jgi:hypothetical protein
MKKFSEYVSEAHTISNNEMNFIIKRLNVTDLRNFTSAAQTIVDSLQFENMDNEKILDFISTYINAKCI